MKDEYRETIHSLSDRVDNSVTVEDIFYCFRLILGRNPNAEEIDCHVEIGLGQSLSNVVTKYLNSYEFHARGLLNPPEAGYRLVKLNGYELYIDPDDQAVGRHVVAGSYEPHVTSIFHRFIKKGDVVVDIGANMGFFTALACSLVGSNGRVFSIEPNSQNCTFIEATRKQNNFFWQKTYCVAATETDMIMSLYSSFSNGSVSASIDNIGALIQSRTIQGVSLDGILNLDRLDFIKIDVEGHEFEALKGFRKAIERSRPVIVSEFSASGMLDPNGYLNFLIGMRYSISVVQHDGALHYCGMDAQLVISRFKESGFDHIDFIALPEAP